MTKKMRKIIIWTSTSVLTLGGATLATVYGISYRNSLNYNDIDERTYDQKLWDQKINDSNFVYNNLFFPLDGEELSTKYLFLNSHLFDSINNKRNLIKSTNDKLETLNDENEFSISLNQLNKENLADSLEKAINDLNKKLVDFKKLNLNKKLAFDLGKDLNNRKLFARIWELKDNVDQSDKQLIDDFMEDLEKTRSSFRKDMDKKHFTTFFNSEQFLSNEILYFIKPEKFNAGTPLYKVNRDFINTPFGDEKSATYIEDYQNGEKDKSKIKHLEENPIFFRNSGFSTKIYHYFFKNLIEKNIVVTTKGFIDFKNQRIKRILYFSKLDEFDGQEDLNSSTVFMTNRPSEIYVKNPKWIVTKEFDITNEIKNVISKDNNNTNNLDLETFFLQEGDELASWRKMINNPIVQMGLEWSGNYTPSVDSYIHKFQKLLAKLNFMDNDKISRVLNKEDDNNVKAKDKIISELKNNSLVNYDDFVYLLNEKFDDDLVPFWTNLEVLSNVTPDIDLKGVSDTKDFSDVYRVYTMVMGMKIIADNLLPIIKSEYPIDYNKQETIDNIFRKVWRLFRRKQIVGRGLKFNEFIAYIIDSSKQVEILERILEKGNNLVIPTEISKEILNILPFFGFNLSLDENAQKRISNILQNYLNEPGSLKNILVNLIGENNKASSLTDQQNKIEKIFLGNKAIKGAIESIIKQYEDDPSKKVSDIKEKDMKDKITEDVAEYEGQNNLTIVNFKNEKEQIWFDIRVDGQTVYYGTAIKRIVNAVFENKTIDPELLSIISEIIFESRLLEGFGETIKIALPEFDISSAKAIEQSINKIFANPQQKQLMKTFILGLEGLN